METYLLVWSFVINGFLFEGQAKFLTLEECEKQKQTLNSYENVRNSPHKILYCEKINEYFLKYNKNHLHD